MTPKIILMAAITGALLWAGAAQAQEADPVRGGQLSATCLGCHAIPGVRNAYPSYRVPKIGGQTEQYLYDALKAYKEGTRQHATMRAQASTLSDQDIRDIAAYFSGNN